MSDSEMKSSIHHVGREARETVDTALNAAGNAAQRIGDAGADAGEAVRDAARKVYQKASDVAGDFGHQALERGSRYSKTAVAQVESQPMTAVLVAAAVGFVAGLLLVRR